MRSDASRNHEAILTSAMTVLARSPQASMQDMALASGTGRTTLYRHFPDRNTLIAAIYDRVLAEADDITARTLSVDEGSDPVQVVADLCVELAGLGDRYRFLDQHLPAPPSKDRDQALSHGAPLLDYLQTAQRRGLIRQDLDATWLFDVLVALITHTVGHTRNDPAQRSAMLHATVSSVLQSPPGA